MKSFLDAFGGIRYDERMLWIYSFSHFLMDFSCAALLFGMSAVPEKMLFGIIVYNFCAFALQMPLGLLTDLVDRNACVAALGCFLTAAVGFLGIDGMWLFILLGIGNGLFHLGGGVDILNQSEENCGWLGVFVAPGALGLFLGKLYGKSPLFSRVPVAAVLFFSVLIILTAAFCRKRTFVSENVPVELRPRRGQVRECLLSAAGLFSVVVLRSFLGQQWICLEPRSLMLAGFCALAAVFGKASGGFIYDRFGLRGIRVSQWSAAFFMILSGWVPVFGVPALFCLNMTMPVTLWGLARIFSGAKGFSFGLLTLALFLGALPFLTNVSGGLPFSAPAWPGVLILAGMTFLGNWFMEKNLRE